MTYDLLGHWSQIRSLIYIFRKIKNFIIKPSALRTTLTCVLMDNFLSCLYFRMKMLFILNLNTIIFHFYLDPCMFFTFTFIPQLISNHIKNLLWRFVTNMLKKIHFYAIHKCNHDRRYCVKKLVTNDFF